LILSLIFGEKAAILTLTFGKNAFLPCIFVKAPFFYPCIFYTNMKRNGGQNWPPSSRKEVKIG